MINKLEIQEALFTMHEGTQHMMDGTWMHGGFIWSGWIIQFLIIVVLILLIIWLGQRIKKDSNKK